MVDIDRIVSRAENRGIKLSYLAGLFGLGRSYFQDVKKRGGDIPEERLRVIAEKLDTTPAYLRGETEEADGSGGLSAGPLSEYDAKILAWFRSLPPEKKEAILNLGDGPKE